MKIMVSACLAGENCKYNGGNNRSEKVLKLMAENEVLTVCPGWAVCLRRAFLQRSVMAWSPPKTVGS